MRLASRVGEGSGLSVEGERPPVARVRRREAAAVCLFALLALLAAPVLAEPDSEASLPPSVEYQIKADFVYTVAKFVEWPDKAFAGPGAPLTFGIVGSDVVADAISVALRGKKVHERPIRTVRITDLRRALECQIVYVSESDPARVKVLLDEVGSANILTVGESGDFADRGGILGIRMRDTLVQFEVNMRSAERAGITISSKILRLGEVVGGVRPASEGRK
jgi:hypothetical protein